MEDVLKQIAGHVALGCEALALICVAVGALQTVVFGGKVIFSHAEGAYAIVWRRFAKWLVLALEFALAADIAETAIAPTWDDIGKLAAIAAIRTALNFFLERDLEVVRTFLPRRRKAEASTPEER